MNKITKVGIIGSGIMGQGIAIAALRGGFDVLLYDKKENIAAEGIKKIAEFFEKSVIKKKITQKQKREIFSRIIAKKNINDLKNCDLLIEAVAEDFKIKSEVFKKLDSVCQKNAIFASNTSTIPITKLALSIERPEILAGMHFMNPAPLIDLVEVVRGEKTSDETMAAVKNAALQMGKIPVEIKDSPGFILNRLLIPLVNEAAFCLQEGVATKENIDKVMKNGANFPLGPLELADFIGIDTCLSIMKELESGFGSEKYHPCPLLEKMVESKKLGRKSGQGFYNY